MKTFPLILMCVLLNTSGELLMKHGMTVVGELHLSLGALPVTIIRVLSSPFNFEGLALYGVSALLWFVILFREELSFALPLVSLTYETVAILSWLFFKETLSLTRVFGIALIICGVFFVYRS